jgi:outer membrane lipoprotein-sorting protein
MKMLVLLAALTLAAPLRPSFAAPHAVVLSDADQATLRSVETYLNGLHTLKAKFLQIGPDGATSTGTAWLDRPGRMRFEYDPPSPLLLVAAHGTVIFRDNKVDQTSNIPMDQTPLGLLLRDQVALSGDVTVTAFQHLPGELRITAVKTASPDDGSLTLDLSDNPLALEGWSVVDAQGRETRVRLSQETLGGDFDPSLFVFVDPHASDFNGNTP